MTARQAGQASVRMRFERIRRAHLLGFAPTGTAVECNGKALFAFEGGIVADFRALDDGHDLTELLRRNA